MIMLGEQLYMLIVCEYIPEDYVPITNIHVING